MVTAPPLPLKSRVVPPIRRSSIYAYLMACGGRDILRFDTPAEATACARLLRERYHADIKVSASYDRVEIRS